MSSKVRRFTQQRLAERSSGPGNPNTGGGSSLREIEDLFVKKLTEKCTLTERNITRVFKRFDKDNSGYLDVDELASAMHLYLNGVDRSRVQELVSYYDVDGDGTISLEEFISFLISRSSENKNDWITIDNLMEQQVNSPRRKAKGRDIDVENFTNLDMGDANSNSKVGGGGESDRPGSPGGTALKATIFLQNMKAFLLKKADEIRVDGKIPVFERLGSHLAPLAESTSRTVLAQAFRPYMKNGTRVDLPSFSRVLTRFTYPGSPPPRREVLAFLFDLCCDGHDKADPDLLVDMLMDKGGIRINRFGFAQEVAAPTDTGRPAVGKGPFVKRDGDKTPAINTVPYRVITPKSKTALAAPSDFDPRLIDRSAYAPKVDLECSHTFGINVNLFSGDPVVYLPGSAREVLYASASKVVIHDLNSNSQCFFDGHSDDISCFAVSADGGLVASGQVGAQPELLVWETVLADNVTTPGPEYPASAPYVRGLVARLGRRFFARGVCAAAFSCDNKFVAAVSCDDKHELGVWAVGTGELMGSMVTVAGVPPQIKTLRWSPSSYQDTTFINKEHEEVPCDLLVTGGDHNYLRFWSFKRPNKQGLGAELSDRGHCTGRELAPPPKVHRCSVFVPREGCEDPVALQYDVLTAGDNGCVYLWRESECIRCSYALPEGKNIASMRLVDEAGYSLLLVGGQDGAIAVLHPESLEVLLTMSVTGQSLPSGTGPVSTRSERRTQKVQQARKPYERPSSETLGRAAGRVPDGAMAHAGKNTGVDVRSGMAATSTGGVFDQSHARPVITKKPLGGKVAKERAKSRWQGPAVEKSIPNLPSGVAPKPDVVGMDVVFSGQEEETGEKPFLLCATGHGRMIRMDLPTFVRGRGLTAPASAPETVMYYHYAPLWAVAAAPLGCTMAPDCSMFASGGDDCWLSFWNAESKSLVVRCRTRAPVRCISIEHSGNLFACGFAGGAWSLFACDTSNSAVKKLKSLGKTGGAFKRATELKYEVMLKETVTRRDCVEDISDIKFSPNGKMVAVGSHDGFIDIYSVKYTRGNLQNLHSDFSVKYLKRLRGHSSFVAHLDWSKDNRIIQSTCGAHELLYWDVASGTQLLSSTDCLEGDTEWSTLSCDLGFGVMGIWQSNMDGSDVNAVDVASDDVLTDSVREADKYSRIGKGSLVATGDDGGCLSVYHYPCVVKHAPGQVGRAHSSHVMSVKWLQSIGSSGAIATAGGNDGAAVVWKVVPL
jgi:WD40 repeat protein